MDYPIEVKPAPKAVWFTPAEAKAYYGRYARDGITIHWWGDGTGANNHDNIVNYFLRRTDGSVNYVLSDNKITMMVNPDNVAWTSQSGNATTVSIEHQPTLGAEGYKKSGWLVWQLEQRYGKTLKLYPHNYWWQTACPGTISLDRIRQEANKWASGGYNPAPAPTPTPPASASLTWTKLPNPVEYATNKQPTKLWNFNQTSWGGFGNGIKDFNKGERVIIYGTARNNTLGATYLVTEYSFNKGITNGFNSADMDVYMAPQPQPVPQPVPPINPNPLPTPEPDKPEWEKNLRDIDNTKMWLSKDQDLIDITTGKATGTKTFKKDEEFVASALTIASGVEYRITDYSFSKKIFNGVPTSALTLTAPGQPDIPPVPENPPIDKNWLIAALTGLIEAIKAIISKLT